jgi:arsenate reductase|tara:strand:- start:1852 stop:2322 length:471 start_codon:yes stop_codon:yes gene_type:complete
VIIVYIFTAPFLSRIMKILILCTGNSCRSQMAEGFLKSFNQGLNVFSAGTVPGVSVHPLAISVMKDINIDISTNFPKSVKDFLSEDFDYVITVCGGAKESCPVFGGKVKNTIHFGFDDPAEASGTDEEIMNEFIRIRNEIEHDFTIFYNELLKPLI